MISRAAFGYNLLRAAAAACLIYDDFNKRSMTENDEFNPYATPRSPVKIAATLRGARVDGNCVVVNSGIELPLRCVATNVDCSAADRKLRKLSYAPSFRLVVRRRNCHFFRCLSPSRKNRYLLIRTLVFTGFFATLWIVCGMILVAGPIAAAFLLTVQPDRLRIVAYKNGEFWIKGFSANFLESLVTKDGWKRV